MPSQAGITPSVVSRILTDGTMRRWYRGMRYESTYHVRKWLSGAICGIRHKPPTGTGDHRRGCRIPLSSAAEISRLPAGLRAA